jgi:hypothetical protein
MKSKGKMQSSKFVHQSKTSTYILDSQRGGVNYEKVKSIPDAMAISSDV